MVSISEFFEINHEVILFLYGLVFFVLGFSIILQTRQASRLELARSLRWLAAFGITHGFHEWGDLFIPLQAKYLDQSILRLLSILHLVLLAISFVCLFEFGMVIVRPRGGGSRFRWASPALFIAWLVVSFGALFPFMSDEHLWRHTANALARYFICFPGGLLAAYGLRVHTLERIQPLNVLKIVRTFRVAGFALGVYSLLAGLIPPPVAFFPGNLLNTATFTQAVGAPPWVFRSLIAAVIAVTLIRALEVFEVETHRCIEELEQQQILIADHERLARELHDGAIQKVYTAGLLVESVSKLAEPGTEMDRRLKRAVVVLNDSIVDLRRNLAELHVPAQTPSEPLAALLQQLADDPNYNSMVNISLEVEFEENNALSPIRSSHVTAIVNEALSNAVRHAHAQHVSIRAAEENGRLRIAIHDNGAGISPDARLGYGLRNMRDRARLLNGTIEFARDKGAVVTLVIPWVD